LFKFMNVLLRGGWKIGICMSANADVQNIFKEYIYMRIYIQYM